MTANEKRARALLDWMGDGDETHPAGDLLKRYAADLDAAERRGEDRVLRRFMRYGYDIEVDEYRRERKAWRRARGSK